MGADKGLGVIDSPIQREIHTTYPIFAGSGIKGALRSYLSQNEDPNFINVIFGPDSNGSEHAGATSFTDANLVAFPIRSNRAPYLYVCSPLSISRTLRQARNVENVKTDDLELKITLEPGQLLASNLKEVKSNNSKNVVLEDVSFDAQDDDRATIFAEWLSDFFGGQEGPLKEFAQRIQDHLVIIPDHEFGYFTRKSTIVEPHVRINRETGTAEDGGLFYVETLPPESILMAMMLTSVERKKTSNPRSAEELSRWSSDRLNQKLVQFGGNATTGRGLALLSIGGINNES